MKTTRIRTYNFSAGPAMLPTPVMEKAQAEFLDFKGSGMSIMEVSHRGDLFLEVIDKATSDLKKLLSVPDQYSILFMPGGATLQFSAIPMNLLKKGEFGDYAITGIFANKAFQEANRLYSARPVYDGKSTGYIEIPKLTENDLHEEAKYLYITSNNTIYGSRYNQFPKIKRIPLIADMTSELLSRKININDFGIIFAGAQKNIGPSGFTVLIIKNDLLNIEKESGVPVLLDYKIMAKSNSLYNTPPTYSIYIAKLVFEWCLESGGVESLEKKNEEKANKLYNFIDSSSLYYTTVKKEFRSTMNVVFFLKNKNLESKFTEEAEERRLHGLPGHRDLGGFRASIYNSMPVEGVEELIHFMEEFEKKYFL